MLEFQNLQVANFRITSPAQHAEGQSCNFRVGHRLASRSLVILHKSTFLCYVFSTVEGGSWGLVAPRAA